MSHIGCVPYIPGPAIFVLGRLGMSLLALGRVLDTDCFWWVRICKCTAFCLLRRVASYLGLCPFFGSGGWPTANLFETATKNQSSGDTKVAVTSRFTWWSSVPQ